MSPRALLQGVCVSDLQETHQAGSKAAGFREQEIELAQPVCSASLLSLASLLPSTPLYLLSPPLRSEEHTSELQSR